MILLGPACLIFVIVSSKYGFSHHARYILPCLPFVFVWLGGQAVNMSKFFGSFQHKALAWSNVSLVDRVQRVWGAMAMLCTGAMILSSLLVFPHSLSYFNEAIGGPKNGPEHLLKSSIDWGQDLLLLEKWIAKKAEPDLPVYLAFDNFYSPFDLPIKRLEPWPFRKDDKLPEYIPDGYYALSVNLLYEFPWAVTMRDGQPYYIDTRRLGTYELRCLKAGLAIPFASTQRTSYAAPMRLHRRFPCGPESPNVEPLSSAAQGSEFGHYRKCDEIY